MRRSWTSGGGGAVAPKTNKRYLSDVATDYKLLELQSVIWKMVKDAVNESFVFIFKLKHPNRGERLFLGGLCLEMKEFQCLETSVALYQ
jgi:hypothetical protein